MSERSEAVVYRMYDADDRLLWVGMSTNAVQRLVGHRSTQHWWPRVARVTLQHFAGRHAAARAESEAIVSEDPEFNKASGNCVSWDTREEREASEAAWRERAERERLERNFWRPEGTIRCGNCLRRPELFPKRQKIEDTQCGRCGCKAFERTIAVVQVPGSGHDAPMAVAS